MPVLVLVLSKFGISESDFFTIVYIRFFQAVWPAARGGSSDRLAVWTTEQYDCNTAAHTAGQTAPWLRGLGYPRMARCCQPLCWRRNATPRNDLFAKRNFSPCMSLSLSFCMAERVDRRDDDRHCWTPNQQPLPLSVEIAAHYPQWLQVLQQVHHRQLGQIMARTSSRTSNRSAIASDNDYLLINGAVDFCMCTEVK